jgi:hypothetical protein
MESIIGARAEPKLSVKFIPGLSMWNFSGTAGALSQKPPIKTRRIGIYWPVDQCPRSQAQRNIQGVMIIRMTIASPAPRESAPAAAPASPAGP